MTDFTETRSMLKKMAMAHGADSAIAEKNAEIARLRAALSEISGPDPEADLDEPDEDWRVVRKLRAIARAALAQRQGQLGG